MTHTLREAAMMARKVIGELHDLPEHREAYDALTAAVAAPDPAPPDYRDGEWWGWNGGECPVHPNDTVALVIDDDGKAVFAGSGAPHGWSWNASKKQGPIIAFRVTKRHREPRSVWVHESGETSLSARSAPGWTEYVEKMG